MKEKVAKKNAIKAYKAFNADWTCRGFQYEVGRTYKADGEISICENGFHACEKASECFSYYPFDPKGIKFAEVLCWGEIERADNNSKICCASIQIVRAMEWEEVLKVCNSGDWNSGYWNSGDWNSGYFNTPAQNKIFCFNKLTSKQKIEFPNFLYFNLIE